MSSVDLFEIQNEAILKLGELGIKVCSIEITADSNDNPEKVVLNRVVIEGIISGDGK